MDSPTHPVLRDVHLQALRDKADYRRDASVIADSLRTDRKLFRRVRIDGLMLHS